MLSIMYPISIYTYGCGGYNLILMNMPSPFRPFKVGLNPSSRNGLGASVRLGSNFTWSIDKATLQFEFTGKHMRILLNHRKNGLDFCPEKHFESFLQLKCAQEIFLRFSQRENVTKVCIYSAANMAQISSVNMYIFK
jgi:hypothetical protein